MFDYLLTKESMFDIILSEQMFKNKSILKSVSGMEFAMMRTKKSIYEMTDRELRTYKRSLRRQREQRRRTVSLLMAVWLVVACVVSYHSLTIRADSGEEERLLKYYTGIIVKSGDTLWNIADEYIDYNKYKNKDLYIREVCSINNLNDESEIHVGQRLIVPYYSAEFKK